VQEGDDLHFQVNQYVEGQPLGLPDDGCKLKRCVEGTVGMNETQISRRQRVNYMKRHGEERSKMPRVGMGKQIASLFQTASVPKGNFF
jgi:hypothetical protein